MRAQERGTCSGRPAVEDGQVGKSPGGSRMRVVVCGRGAVDARSAAWGHVAASLRSLGYEVITFDPSSPEKSGLVRGDAVGSLRKLLAEQRPHLLIHIPTPGDISPAEVGMLTAASETVAIALHTGCTFADAPTRCSEASEHLRDYDLVAVPDPWTAGRLADEGGYRLACLAPAVHAPTLDNAVSSGRSGVVVIGEPDERGAGIARAMIDAGVDVRLYGDGWREQPDLEANCFAPLPYPELGTVLASASLLVELPIPAETQSLLGISAWEADLGQSVFDAACVATPSLALSRPGVDAFFERGESVYTFHDDSDIGDLVPMLLADRSNLEAVGQAAADQVRSAHRWTDRWVDLLKPFAQPDDDGEAVSVRPVAAAKSSVVAQ